MKRIIKNNLWVGGLIVLLLIWILASQFSWLDNTLLASPMETFSVLGDAFSGKNDLYSHFKETIILVFSGWIVSLILGLVIGLLFGYIQTLLKTFEIVVEFFRAIPPILAFPLMLVAFNFETSAYVWTIVFGCLPIMILTVSNGVSHLSKNRLELLKVYRIKTSQVIWIKIVEMLPSIFLGARLTFSFALIIAVVCEMVFTPKSGLSLGALARDAEMNFDTPTFYAVILLVGIVGFIINSGLKLLEKKFSTNDN